MTETAVFGEISEKLFRYKRFLSRYQTDPATAEPKQVLSVLTKLDKLAIGLDHLEESGIGKTVHGFRKHADPLGSLARSLVAKWKSLVKIAIEQDYRDKITSDFEGATSGKDSCSDPKLLEVDAVYQHEISPAAALSKNVANNGERNNGGDARSSETSVSKHREDRHRNDTVKKASSAEGATSSRNRPHDDITKSSNNKDCSNHQSRDRCVEGKLLPDKSSANHLSPDKNDDSKKSQEKSLSNHLSTNKSSDSKKSQQKSSSNHLSSHEKNDDSKKLQDSSSSSYDHSDDVRRLHDKSSSNHSLSRQSRVDDDKMLHDKHSTKPSSHDRSAEDVIKMSQETKTNLSLRDKSEVEMSRDKKSSSHSSSMRTHVNGDVRTSQDRKSSSHSSERTNGNIDVIKTSQNRKSSSHSSERTNSNADVVKPSRDKKDSPSSELTNSKLDAVKTSRDKKNSYSSEQANGGPNAVKTSQEKKSSSYSSAERPNGNSINSSSVKSLSTHSSHSKSSSNRAKPSQEKLSSSSQNPSSQNSIPSDSSNHLMNNVLPLCTDSSPEAAAREFTKIKHIYLPIVADTPTIVESITKVDNKISGLGSSTGSSKSEESKNKKSCAGSLDRIKSGENARDMLSGKTHVSWKISVQADDIDNDDEPTDVKAGVSFEDILNYDTGTGSSKLQKKRSSSKNTKPRSPPSKKSKVSSSDDESSLPGSQSISSGGRDGLSEKPGKGSTSSRYAFGAFSIGEKASVSNGSAASGKFGVMPPRPVDPIDLSIDDLMLDTTTAYKVAAASGPMKLPDNKQYFNGDDDDESGELSVAGVKRRTRTQVYSGRKQIYLTAVPTLRNACLRVLTDNIDSLQYVGGVPFEILQPVLEQCTPTQLYCIEDHNPQFVSESDRLWEAHCRKDFKGCQPVDEIDSWREVYLRKFDEREAKLKKIASNISASSSKSKPVRIAKLAYVDSVAKPPREVRRKQIKNNTANALVSNSHLRKLDTIASSASTSHAGGDNHSSASSSSSRVSTAHRRTETFESRQKAVKVTRPLMQQTLKFMKNMQRR